MRFRIGIVPRDRLIPPEIHRGFPATLLLVLACAGALVAGCRPRSSATKVHIEVHFGDSHPVVGQNAFTVRIADAAGNPVRLQDAEVEGDMNHAGMKPVFAKLDQIAPGKYSGTIEFTMGGDWFLLVSGKTPDAVRFESKVDVPGVQAK